MLRFWPNGSSRCQFSLEVATQVSSPTLNEYRCHGIVVGHRPSYGRGTKCVFLGFCCVDATQVMGVMGWGGGDGNVP